MRPINQPSSYVNDEFIYIKIGSQTIWPTDRQKVRGFQTEIETDRWNKRQTDRQNNIQEFLDGD